MSNTWGIIGGGFGLYGYLPALVEIGVKRLLIHEKYLPLIGSRAELCRYIPNVEPIAFNEEILSRAESLVCAVPPVAQEAYILNKVSKRYKYLLLEKPLGRSPSSAELVYQKGIEISDSMRVGYSFIYTQWTQKLLQKIPKEEMLECKIIWRFDSYHHRNKLITWKSDHDCGGGALRFYGIQLIAFVTLLGEVDNFIESKLFFDEGNDAYKWDAKLAMKNGALISIELDSQSPQDQFKLLARGRNQEFNSELVNPFDGEFKFGDQDNRVHLLSKVLSSFSVDSNGYNYYQYSSINETWNSIEAITQYVYS